MKSKTIGDMSLFKKAKNSEVSKTGRSKDTKPRVTVSDEFFFDKVRALQEIQKRMKNDEAKSDILMDEIKDVAKDEWVNLYKSTRKNPGSIVLESVREDETAQVMYVPSDKYIKIDGKRAGELVEKWGGDIVEEKTTFSFDDAMIEKYADVISRLIEESDEILQSDKEKIIKSKTEFTISKGTIDKIVDYGDVNEVIDEIRPVVSIKNVEVIKG